MDNYLLDALDRLTQKHVTKVVQEKNGIACISDVDHEPLLLQLRNAVAGGTSPHAGSSSASERIPFDPGASALFDEIARQINAWYIALPNAKEERYIHDRLCDWYIDYSNRLRAGKISTQMEVDTLRLVTGWARAIEAMFDPPQSIEIPGECPVCSGRYAIDPKSGDRITALVLEYRNLGVETIDKATGLCRSCLTVWHGGSGIRAMRWGIDNPEPIDVTQPVTVDGYTTEVLDRGIKAAVNERNMKAATSLIGKLATVEPESAEAWQVRVRQALDDDEKLRSRRQSRVGGSAA